jgi:ABC-type sugar transport system ATPase subunit
MEHITKHFGGVYAVSDVSFDLHRGEVLAVVGDNGAGKSTLIKMLSGAYEADEGSIYISGEKVRIESPMDARKLGIETIYQHLALMNNLDIPANVFMGREIRARGILGKLGLMDLRQMRENSVELLKGFEIQVPDPNREVEHLSGGQRQMVTISRAVYFQAQVIIMDEPTAALGVSETRKVYEFIQRLKASGIAVIIISHNINEVFELADRFLVLKTGRLVSSKRKDDTTIDQIVTMIISGKAE